MKLRFALLIACVLPLGSCGTVSAIATGGGLASASPTTIVDAEKALTVAHLAYNGISTAIQTLTASGALRGPTAASVKVWYDKAGDALSAADAADRALNAGNILSAVSAAEDAIAQANSIIHPKN